MYFVTDGCQPVNFFFLAFYVLNILQFTLFFIVFTTYPVIAFLNDEMKMIFI